MTSSLLGARRGSQVPRVANYPSYSYSDADEVVELYEVATGRTLDPWQKLVLRHGLGKLTPEQYAAWKVAVWVARQNGKGDIILALELAWLFLPGFQVPLVTHSAHLYSTAQEAFLRMKEVLDGCDWLRPEIRAIREANGEQGVILNSGQRLKFMARTRTGGRGFSSRRIVLDEAQELQDLMMAAALPTMSAQPDPQVWFFGTPPDDPAAWCYNLKADGEAGTDDLAWFDWGAALDLDKAEDRLRVRDPELWYACNPALGVRISERFVQGELKPSGLGDMFAHERLGVWRPRALGGSAVLPEHLWLALADPASQVTNPVAFALDVTPDRASGAIAVAGRRDDGLLHQEVVDHRPGTGWMVDRMADLVERWQPCAVALDAAGPAGALLTDLQDRGIEIQVVNAREAAQACGGWYDDVIEGRVRHLDQPSLNAALAGAKQRPLGDAWGWHRRNSTVDISPLVAVTLARHAFAVHGTESDPLDNIW